MATDVPMSESVLQDAIAELANLHGFDVAHFRAARTQGGWRTAGQYQAKGFPDLTIAGWGRIIFAEIKSATGRVTLDQHAWLDQLRDTDAEVYVWYPKDWTDGTVEAILRQGL